MIGLSQTIFNLFILGHRSLADMIKIRRLVDRKRAYTGIFLPGEPARIFPTSEQEHARIMQIYLQDRPHEGIVNDFSEYRLHDTPPPPRD